jgi:signal transduction histidine kinase
VAKIIVEQHHGKIWAESPGIGQGSTFVFSIPIANKLEATTFDLVEQKQ